MRPLSSPSAGAGVSRRLAWIALLALGTAWFVRPAAFSVWDANEAFYVQTPREMLERGDWLLPTFNGSPRLNKPPLSYWIVAAGYRLFGVSLAVERLWMAAAAAGTLALTFLLALELWRHHGKALLSAVILAATFRFQVLHRRLLIDSLLVLWSCAFAYCFVRWLRTRRPAWAAAAGVAVGLGFLSKGPVIGLPVAAAALVLLWPGRRDRPLLRDLVTFGVPALLIGASWFVALGLREGWGPVWDFFLKENVGRFRDITFGPRRGPLYYVPVFLADLFPWSLLWAAALPALVQGVWTRPPDTLSDRDWSGRFLLLWWSVTFLFFSFSLNKQEYYLAPSYPAVAVWVGGLAAGTRGFPAAARLGGAVFLLVAPAAAVLGGLGLSSVLILPGIGLAVAGAYLLGRRWMPAAAVLAGTFFTSAWLLPEVIEPYRPVRPLAQEIQERVRGLPAAAWTAGYYRFTAPSLCFYLDRPILELYDLAEAVRRLEGPETVFLLVEEGDLAALRERVGEARCAVVASRPHLETRLRRWWEAVLAGERQPPVRQVFLITNRRGDPAPRQAGGAFAGSCQGASDSVSFRRSHT
ncbi:MAG: hypothetical protein Kow00109_16450 [Acidobacteriota bacterium]